MEKQGLTEASGVLNTGDFDQRYWEVTSGPIPRFLCKLRVDVPLHSIVNRERLKQCVYRFIPLISPFVECLACLRACVNVGGWVGVWSRYGVHKAWKAATSAEPRPWRNDYGIMAVIRLLFPRLLDNRCKSDKINECLVGDAWSLSLWTTLQNMKTRYG